MFRTFAFAAALLAITASAAGAQPGRPLTARLDSLAASGVVENRAVGIVAAVVRGNDTLLLKGYGKADVEWDVPMPVDAVFEIGSVSKQFTAVALLQLRDQGKLSLDDEITKWLPDFDMRGNVSPASYAELIAPSKLNDGTPLRYGMGLQAGPDPSGHQYIGHGGAIAGFTAEVGWYPAAKMAVVGLQNTAGTLDPGAVAGELAREVLGWTPQRPQQFAGDGAPLEGRYVGQGRGREVVIEVMQTPQGLAFSSDGAPARPVPWVEGLTFRQGTRILTFRRANGDSGPVTELRVSTPSAHMILKKQ